MSGLAFRSSPPSGGLEPGSWSWLLGGACMLYAPLGVSPSQTVDGTRMPIVSAIALRSSSPFLGAMQRPSPYRTVDGCNKQIDRRDSMPIVPEDFVGCPSGVFSGRSRGPLVWGSCRPNPIPWWSCPAGLDCRVCPRPSSLCLWMPCPPGGHTCYCTPVSARSLVRAKPPCRRAPCVSGPIRAKAALHAAWARILEIGQSRWSDYMRGTGCLPERRVV